MTGGAQLRDRARRLRIPLAASLLAVTLLALAVGVTVSEYRKDRNDEEVALRQAAATQAQALDNYFARARSLTKLLARNPAYQDFYEVPGARLEKISAQGPQVQEANGALSYLERLYPDSIGEACFIDDNGSENARAVRGVIASKGDLSTEEASAPFFAPTFDLEPGQVYQAKPYVSPDTFEWVVANSTRVPLPESAGAAIVHFEVTVESFRKQAALEGGDAQIAVVDINSGRTVLDSRYPQPDGEESRLGPPDSDRFAEIAAFGSPAQQELDGRLTARKMLDANPYNANSWAVIAVSPAAAPTWINSLGLAHFGVFGAAALLLAFALTSIRASHRVLSDAAHTDPLTGLGNRRALTRDLEARLARTGSSSMLVLFDLDGFKDYNDTFGHPAGDALLTRLAHRLRASVKGLGEAYRIGGDEFCVVAGDTDQQALLKRAEEALSERGEGFSVTASRGWVEIPGETDQPAEALRLADQRMYANKAAGRASAGRQTTDVLVRVLAERYPDIGHHLGHVAALCGQLADELKLPEEELRAVVQAAELHDIGKIAIPDSVLTKPGPLDDDEWQFMRQHTLIGERILAVAPALSQASKLVRWSHERIDGDGYPDAIDGEKIPLGARIIAVCDAYDAMTSDRPYAKPMSRDDALAELRRCAGAQFDEAVVEAFAAVVEKQGETPTPVAG